MGRATRAGHRTTLTTLIASIALLALVLGACSSKQSGGNGSAAGGKPSGDVSVAINWTGAELDAFKAVVAGFQIANPGVNVKLVQIPFDDMQAQLTQQFAAGSQPDLTVALPGLIRQLSDQDLLQPLDDLWDQWVADGEYTKSLRDIASFGDHTYGVWFKGNVNALVWYQPSVLQRLGIGVPTTWQEFDAAAAKAKAAGMEPFAVGGSDLWPLTQWSDAFLLRVAGADAFNGLAKGTVKWNDPRVVKAFQTLSDFMAKYFPSDALDRKFSDEVCAWANRKAAFDNQGAFVNLIAPSECDKKLVPGKGYSFFLMPKFDQSAADAQFVSGDLFAVAKEAHNKTAAMALARYLGSADAQGIWAKRGGFVAPNAKVPTNVYPNVNDVKAAELWPRNPATQAGYDLDDYIGGEIQSTEREALQQLVRDHDPNAFIASMMKVDTRAAG
jgi:alpha-glucoside transport system substrate-binding protein